MNWLAAAVALLVAGVVVVGVRQQRRHERREMERLRRVVRERRPVSAWPPPRSHSTANSSPVVHDSGSLASDIALTHLVLSDSHCDAPGGHGDSGGGCNSSCGSSSCGSSSCGGGGD